MSNGMDDTNRFEHAYNMSMEWNQQLREALQGLLDNAIFAPCTVFDKAEEALGIHPDFITPAPPKGATE